MQKACSAAKDRDGLDVHLHRVQWDVECSDSVATKSISDCRFKRSFARHIRLKDVHALTAWHAVSIALQVRVSATFK